MTLKEMKQKVLRLIEEIDNSEKLTSDPDIAEKLNDVINQVMFELCRIKKTLTHDTRMVVADEVFDLLQLERFYQLKAIRCVNDDGDYVAFEQMDNLLIFEEDAEVRLFYYVLPESITHDTEDTYEFDIMADVLEIIPYGVAADLLKSDVSSNYGQVYAQRYAELKQMLDPRHSLVMVSFEGGVDI